LLASSGKLDKEKIYWLEHLDGDITIGTFFPKRDSVEQIEERFHFPGPLFDDMLHIGGGSEYGVFLLLVTGLTCLVSRYTGKEDIIIGVPVLNSGNTRHRFNRLLPLRNHVMKGSRFKDLLLQVKQTVSDAETHREFPLDHFVHQGQLPAAVHRLCDTLVVLDTIHGTTPDIDTLFGTVFRFHMSNEALECRLLYQAADFMDTPAGIRSLWEHLLRFFNRAFRQTDVLLRDISLLNEEERHKVLETFNATAFPDPGCLPRDIYRHLADRVQKLPHRVALLEETDSAANRDDTDVGAIHQSSPQTVHLTFRELHTRALRLARLLRANGVLPGTIVGIMQPRSLRQMVTIAAVLATGAAFVALDPKFPETRIAFMIKDTGLRLIAADSTTTQAAGSFGCTILDVEAEESGHFVEIIDVETSPPPGDNYQAPGNHPAYIIYTSGSTGTPKGVQGLHRGVLNRCGWMWERYPFTGDDVCCQKTSMNFVDFIWEVFGPLLAGIPSLILADDRLLEFPALVRSLARSRVTRIVLVPGLLYRFFDPQENHYRHLPRLTFWVTSGEALGSEFPGRFRRCAPDSVLLNLYGSSEASADVTYYEVTDPANPDLPAVPIGKPIHNTHIYILDRYMQPVPIGVAGEIYIGGEGLAGGYLNRPQLTADTFVIDPFSRDADARLFKSGDLGRFLPDGTIMYMGRKDHQVKIRGYRIELGEIENCLLNHPQVDRAVVMVRGTNNGSSREDACLCAYLVFTDCDLPAPGSKDLNEYLARRLPSYMIPRYYIPLQELPLTPSGKPLRSALPDPDLPGLQGEYAAPQTAVERALVRLWAEVLDLGPDLIGIDADFFRLGGHSLKATSLSVKIHRMLDVSVPVKEIFKQPTIRRMARYIRGQAAHRQAPLEPVEEKEYYPLSSAQRRLYVLRQMEPLSTVYNIYQVMKVEGEPCREKLEQAVRQLIRRHESLRTVFFMKQGQVFQAVKQAEEVNFSIEYDESTDPHITVEERVARCIRPFDPGHLPLFRMALVKTCPAEYILVADMHHLISDGISLNLLIRDFSRCYAGDPLLPQIQVRYRDFVHRQEQMRGSPSMLSQRQYWLERFDPADDLPVLDIAADFVRPSLRSFEGSSTGFSIGAEETAALRELAAAAGATLFMVLLTAFHIFLSRLGNRQDIVIGSPIAGRNHEDLEEVIGVFVNTLALRNRSCPTRTVRQFLGEVKENTLAAFENREYQYEDLVEEIITDRDVSRNPLFDVMFILHNMDIQQLEIPGLILSPLNTGTRTAMFDLTMEAIERDNHLDVVLSYCTRLFKPDTVDRFITYFKETVCTMLRHPDLRLADVDILPQAEKVKLLLTFNDTDTTYQKDKTVIQLFHEQVARTPQHTAVSIGDTRLDYRQLDRQANHLAGVLIERGMGPGKIAAVLAGRSVQLVTAILAILKSGAAYLPVDPAYPSRRVRFLLEDSSTGILLTDIPEVIADNRERSGLSLLDLTDPQYFTGSGSLPAACTAAGAVDPAYIVYTSGTTGRPKGVMVENRSVVNFIKGITEVIPFTPGDAILSLTTISFDIFGLETLLPLSCGSKVVMGTEEEQLNSTAAADAMLREEVTIFQVTPSRLKLFLDERSDNVSDSLKRLTFLLVGGEAFPTELHRMIVPMVKGKIYNMYGPAETTIWSTMKEVSAGHALNIGKPIANTRIYILGSGGWLQPVGVAGELHIAGDGLARGYLNRPQLTAEKFTALNTSYLSYRSHRSPAASDRLYSTGDLAAWLPEGNIRFLGRRDHQVKIRGYRIEPEEVESLLTARSDIAGAVVIAAAGSGGELYLCAYIVPTVSAPDTRTMRDHLAAHLPDYMVPSFFVALDKIPLTPNGKVDRKALPQPGQETMQTGTDYTAPGNPMEEKIARLCCKVLAVETIGIHDNFFLLGANSLKIIQLNSRLKEELQLAIPVVLMFKYLTVHTLAHYLSEQQTGAATEAAAPSTGLTHRPEQVQQAKLRIKRKMKQRGIAYD
jgi:amino acid adenylation domain-containing protein